MKIQLLSYRNGFDKYSVVHNNMDTPHTFDSFDVNIVDLNDKNIFVNKDTDQKNINKKVEVQQLKKIIESSNRSISVVILPQNMNYDYSWGFISNGRGGGSGYRECCLLSNMLSSLEGILQMTIIPQGMKFKLCYEISTTKCGTSALKSDFCFDEKSIQCPYDYDFATRANDSDKPTTIHFNNTYITTLDILNTPEVLMNYLESLKILDIE